MLGKGAFRAVSFSRREPRRQNAVVLGGSNSKKGLLDCIAFSIPRSLVRESTQGYNRRSAA